MLTTVGLCMAQLKWSHFITARSSSSSSSSAAAAKPLSEFYAIDQASRGPVGSLAALPAVLAMPLVLVGALVMVAAGGFDFAVQQLVSLEPRAAAVQLAVEAGETFVPRAQFFRQNRHHHHQHHGRIPTVFAPGTGLVAAIDNGCGGDPAAVDVTATCPTGNCTFPVFNTLAMCSRCVDIRAQLRRVALEPRPDDGSNSTVYEVQWIAPGNATLIQRVVGLASNGSTLNQTFVVSSAAGTQWPALGWPDDAVAPLGLTVIKFRYRPLAVDAVDAPPLAAWQCGISPCVRTLAVSVVNGRQHTSVLAEYKNDTQLATWMHRRGRGSYSLRPPVVTDEERAAAAMMRRNSSSKAAKKHTARPLRLRPDMMHRFEISHAAMSLLADVLKAFFEGTYELGHQTRMSEDRGLVDPPSGRGPYYLDATRDVPGLMANVSDALTSYFRRQQQMRSRSRSRFPANNTTANSTTPYQNTTTTTRRGMVRGVATTEQVLVSVAWAWLSMPILLVACSAMLLVATAVNSSATGAPLWKDSCLPMIFHGLGESGLPVKFRGGKGTRAEMRAVARRLNVAICQEEEDPDRVKFVAESEVPAFPRSG
ncbi:hypothetical protein MAPG_10587 [Magnaporthiopsis poae ATCC 64411]|uniref:Uncharacterized protein n=1 Tax=Magnaporthiopsis poae (strain ATCC 64411 / 73-15) TaxID=644358 RepID=A0A0C4ECZ7_MAGP6|nr:hypothetical protein MAPG_10587 [Magnaporthiopsis poae ATCC 64411]